MMTANSLSILVTGVAGFIGSHLAERLLRQGYSVVGIDCFTDYYARALKERNVGSLRPYKRFTLIEGDLLDLDLERLLKHGREDEPPSMRGGPIGSRPFDYVFHLAAQPGVRGSWGENFAVYTRNNILATQRLLEAAKECSLKKFVYASSSSVYGDAEQLPTSEQVTPRPISPYGVTKLAAEHLCLLYWRNYGVPVSAPRYFTVYGPRQRPDMAFHRFIRAVLHDEEILLYGDGEQSRDFTFVSDAVEGTLSAAFSDSVGQVFNIGGGCRVTVNQVIKTLGRILQRDPRVRYLESQKGDAKHTAAEIQAASALLGYKPRVSLEEGLCLEAAWARHLFEGTNF